MYCDYCKLKNYKRDKCYKLVGYPQDFRFKNKEPNVACNAMMETTRSHEQVPHKHLTTTDNSSQFTTSDYGQSSNEGNSQLEPCHLSINRYQKLLQFLNKALE